MTENTQGNRANVLRKLAPEELRGFIEEAIKNRRCPNNKRVIIGEISDRARRRIETVSGKAVKNVNLDSSGIIHALKKPNHNLEIEDLLLAVEAINTAAEIELDERKHQDSGVLIFRKDIDGEITFLTEIHAKSGYLLVFNAWRQKKARSRSRSNATRGPQGAHVQDETTHDEPLAGGAAPKGNDGDSSFIVSP